MVFPRGCTCVLSSRVTQGWGGGRQGPCPGRRSPGRQCSPAAPRGPTTGRTTSEKPVFSCMVSPFNDVFLCVYGFFGKTGLLLPTKGSGPLRPCVMPPRRTKTRYPCSFRGPSTLPFLEEGASSKKDITFGVRVRGKDYIDNVHTSFFTCCGWAPRRGSTNKFSTQKYFCNGTLSSLLRIIGFLGCLEAGSEDRRMRTKGPRTEKKKKRAEKLARVGVHRPCIADLGEIGKNKLHPANHPKLPEAEGRRSVVTPQKS